jgi:hypothetical protein
VKVKLRFTREAASCPHISYVVPGLEHEIIIGRDFIFEHGLLMSKQKLCFPSPPGEDEILPELLIMAMSKLSKNRIHEPLHLESSADSHEAEKEDQDERTTAKERENQIQRDKEANEIRERLANLALSSSNASANTSVPSSSSGSSNTTK